MFFPPVKVKVVTINFAQWHVLTTTPGPFKTPGLFAAA